MHNKNILNVMFLPWRAGTELAFLNYTRSLQAFGCNVVNLIHPKAQIKRDLENIGSKVIKSQRIGRGRYDFIAIWYYRYLIKKLNIDIVIAHQGRTAMLFTKACEGLAKLVTVNHSHNPKHSIKADIAIVLSKKKKTQLLALGYPKSNVRYIPNRHNLREVPEFKDKDISAMLNLGFYGRFTEQKAPEILLEIAKILKEKGVEFKFYIGGQGELAGLLRRRVQDYKLENQVEILGWVRNQREFFNRIDMFVMPSRWEQNPLTLVEAFAYSTPVITTKSEGIEDMVEDGKTGFLCKIDDANEMVDKILELKSDKKRYNKIARDAYKQIEKKYTEQVFNKSLKEAIESVL